MWNFPTRIRFRSREVRNDGAFDVELRTREEREDDDEEVGRRTYCFSGGGNRVIVGIVGPSSRIACWDERGKGKGEVCYERARIGEIFNRKGVTPRRFVWA